jgi:hypothetical protein
MFVPYVQSLLTWLWKSSSSSFFVKKYVAAPQAVDTIAITNKKNEHRAMAHSLGFGPRDT